MVMPATSGSDNYSGECGEAGKLSVARPLLAIHSDASDFQKMSEQRGRELGWIFDGEGFVHARVIHGHGPPQGQSGRARLSIDVDLTATTCRSSYQPIVDRVIVGERRDAHEGFIAGAGARQNVHENNVVIDGKGGDWGSVRPHQIVLAPTLAIALKCKVRVICNHIAVNILDSLLH